jgi:hypothetical protein
VKATTLCLLPYHQKHSLKQRTEMFETVKKIVTEREIGVNLWSLADEDSLLM